MSTYQSSGHAYLVCPRLLALDKRHGEHPTKWKPCRRGLPCQHPHPHDQGELIDPEGHSVVDYFWVPGARPMTPDEHPSCDLCGSRLVHADLDDPYHPKHLAKGV